VGALNSKFQGKILYEGQQVPRTTTNALIPSKFLFKSSKFATTSTANLNIANQKTIMGGKDTPTDSDSANIIKWSKYSTISQYQSAVANSTNNIGEELPIVTSAM